ncbi:hypothetical protein CCHR01_13990 [Colletotrichum chrysophilum]|uniref:Secreted protein n=1 Tax=Colletotrichum chrysophilum TaxID=1836956 RepID=A0AAD9ECP7_9PEZI|nr:hypothetical protein K456DRAFT_509875 [Colletotrichum gloeosporioides 23]KAK1843378.1 hypothetical protein CCHR01_13990 [Colletotrichum chrysophilum]
MSSCGLMVLLEFSVIQAEYQTSPFSARCGTWPKCEPRDRLGVGELVGAVDQWRSPNRRSVPRPLAYVCGARHGDTAEQIHV